MKRHYAVKMILDQYPELKYEHVVRRLETQTYVSLPHRYMYFTVSKAANTTVKHILHTVENLPPVKLFVGRWDWDTRRDMSIHSRANMPMPCLLDLDDCVQKEVLESPDFFRMSVVRNPYTRLISAWRNRVQLCEPEYAYLYLKIRGRLPDAGKKSLISFEEFVDYISANQDLSTCDLHWRRQVDHIFIKALNYSHIGKTEKLADTLQRFQQHLGRTEPFPRDSRNASGFETAVTLTEGLADAIHSLYRPDFEAFGYDRNSWVALQKRTDPSQDNGKVPEEVYNDEIVERNIMLYHLYRERDLLRNRTLLGMFRLLYRKLRNLLSVPLRNMERTAFKWSYNRRSAQ